MPSLFAGAMQIYLLFLSDFFFIPSTAATAAQNYDTTTIITN
jgi:hypothetical protein